MILLKKQYANHKTIKRELIDVKSSTLVDFDVKIIDRVAKFEDGDYIRLSKQKNTFAKT